jgi:hypothetical protein
MSLVRLYARRFVITGTSGLALFTAYKSKTDPVHFFWDLDQTLLCSICPIPNDNSNNNIDNNKEDGMTRRMVSNLLLPQPPKLQYFDQIDDDFPYDIQTLSPNTRTYIRPGAMLALYALYESIVRADSTISGSGDNVEQSNETDDSNIARSAAEHYAEDRTDDWQEIHNNNQIRRGEDR